MPVAMADYQRQQQEELDRFKAELAAAAAARELAQREGEVDEDLPAFKPSPDNVLSKRSEEYVSQSEGNNWSAERTTPAFVAMFVEFQQWWGADQDIRFITRKVVNRFIVHSSYGHVGRLPLASKNYSQRPA
jgi:hypothetical protein